MTMGDDDKPRAAAGPNENNNNLETTSRLLQRQLNESTVKHEQEVYWLRLELDTSRREKKAVEDRMAELYRDLQEDSSSSRQRRRPLVLDADYVAGLHGQMEKYERMLRIMNNQISLVRSSSDSVVQNLKEELSDLMDEKCRTEVELMNKLTDAEKEKKKLQLSTSDRKHSSESKGTTREARQSTEHENGDKDSMQLSAEISRLKKDNNDLATTLENERSSSRDSGARGKLERAQLSNQVDSLQKELLVIRSSSDAVQRLDQMNQDREETAQTLERVSLLWDRADESIHNLESVIMELRPRGDDVGEDNERLLSTLETASLVHGQVKVSLMLIELKLRNNLACLNNDSTHLGAMAFTEFSVRERVDEIQNDAMAAIGQVQDLLAQQMKKLDELSEEERKIVRETLQSKVKDLGLMQSRQKQLEADISKVHEGGNGHAAPNPQTAGNSDLFVSRKVMERLQEEVLQVVERVKEKNEMIGRLKANVEEHKVREKSLMEELKRHMKEQAERRRQEQIRISADNAKRELEAGSNSECELTTVEDDNNNEQSC